LRVIGTIGMMIGVGQEAMKAIMRVFMARLGQLRGLAFRCCWPWAAYGCGEGIEGAHRRGPSLGNETMWEDRQQRGPSDGFNADELWHATQDWLAILLGVMLFGGIAGGWWAIILTVMRLL
jgi:hypothetical protein